MTDNHSPPKSDTEVGGAPTQSQKRRKLVIFVVILAVIAYVGGNGMKNAWILQRQIECSRCLQRIAEGLSTYNYDMKTAQQTPIEFLRAKGLEEKWLICPRRTGLQSNYVITGLPSEAKGADAEIIIYEPLANHDNKGANILYANGHAQFLKPDEYREMIRKDK